VIGTEFGGGTREVEVRVLILNPNTSEVFTSAIQMAADKYKAPGTQVTAMNPASGPRSIESVYDQLLSCQPCLEVFINCARDYDGFVVACFGDHPVIQAAREITSKPVLGMFEASLYTACMLGYRFSVVNTGDRARDPRLWDALRRYGVAHRCASDRPTGMTVLDLESAGESSVRQRITDEARRAVEEDGADVIILGCAGMVGLDKEVQSKVGVPVVDGVAAALKLIEALIGYGVETSKAGAYSLPEAKELLNLAPVFRKPYA